MAYILIDGYNLIGIAHDNLEKARNELVRRLQEYSQIKKHDITLVFDGWKSGQKDQTRMKSGHVTVMYSRLGETADVLIRKKLTSTKKPWIVVSSDREISDFAANKDFAAVSSDEFEVKLFTTLHGNHIDLIPDMQTDNEELLKYYNDEPDPSPARLKGNPRKLSKRQKKKLQALKKL